ncbi:hypothetical protein B484DRAFT_86532 [Ochromonadaceae sp. CCMP2298]|nr:hypothetical protein B484DRAFT_86532 [Ochromonadaceae sp. CCMP2298]
MGSIRIPLQLPLPYKGGLHLGQKLLGKSRHRVTFARMRWSLREWCSGAGSCSCTRTRWIWGLCCRPTCQLGTNEGEGAGGAKVLHCRLSAGCWVLGAGCWVLGGVENTANLISSQPRFV